MLEIETVDYHTAGEPFRIVTAGAEPLRGETILAKRRDAARAPRRGEAPAGQRAARPRRHVRLLRHGAGGRRRRPRGRLLPQRRLLDRVRPRDDRARHLGARVRRAADRRRRDARRRRRAVGPARDRCARGRRRRRLGALPQRRRPSCGAATSLPGVDVAFGGAFYASSRSASSPRAAAPDRPRARAQGRDRSASTTSSTRSSPSCATSTA